MARGVGKAAVGLLVLAVLALAVVAGLYGGSMWRLRQLPKVPNVVHDVPPLGDPIEGERLAAVLGCRGCHGPDLGGNADCYEDPGKYRIVCPNITEARDRYDDRAIVILLRYGRKLDGALVDFMPWDMYSHLSDKDLSDVLAYVRATPAVRNALPSSSYSWSIRWDMLRGAYPPQNDLADYDTTVREGPAERGRYLASVACPECHAPDLRGYPGDSAPNLVVAKAYSAEQFARLMRDGITIAGTESASGLMTAMARTRFKYLRPEEVAALKAYLDERAP